MENLRQIIQAGMGVYIGTPGTAKEAALNGAYGTVSGALADQILVRALQLGDTGGRFRRALSEENFPYPEIANPIIEKYFVLGGENRTFKIAPKMTLRPTKESVALTVCANFALVWLAKEKHNNPISINFMEKIQMPLIYGIVGAMLANVDRITVGAGIPFKVPGVIDAISRGENPTYDISIDNYPQKTIRVEFDLEKFFGGKFPKLNRPDFVPIISSTKLASILLKRSNGEIQGFIVENYTAGGHNAPPRDGIILNERGEPIYNQNDIPDLSLMRQTGLPFWLAGGFASKEALNWALNEGASGVQLGSIFALCNESGMRKDVKEQVIKQLFYGETEVFTDPYASPTGFPFKIVDVEESVADLILMENRKRVCDMGALMHPYFTSDASIKYRCSAEPRKNYTKKGGKEGDARCSYCLCNGLLDNSILNCNGGGFATVTLGSNCDFLKAIIKETGGNHSYSVKDIMKFMGVA